MNAGSRDDLTPCVLRVTLPLLLAAVVVRSCDDASLVGAMVSVWAFVGSGSELGLEWSDSAGSAQTEPHLAVGYGVPYSLVRPQAKRVASFSGD